MANFYKDVPLIQSNGDTHYPRTTEDSVWDKDNKRLDNKLNDYEGRIGVREKLQTATGTATSIILNGVRLEDGFSITFIANGNNNGSATSINGKRLYKPNTTSTPTLIAGKAYTVWFNTSKDCFFMQASAEGTAVAGDVLASKTFSNDSDTGIEGTMANRGAVTYTPTDLTQSGSAGYYSGITVNPRPSLTGNAVAGDVLAGKTFYGSDYTKKTGTIPSKTSAIYQPKTLTQTIQAGQYLSGAQTILGDTNLIPENIKKGVSVFGVNGTLEEAQYKSATGTITSSTSTVSTQVQRHGGTVTASVPTITVSGLDFYPSIITAESETELGQIKAYIMYNGAFVTIQGMYRIELDYTTFTVEPGRFTIPAYFDSTSELQGRAFTWRAWGV